MIVGMAGAVWAEAGLEEADFGALGVSRGRDENQPSVDAVRCGCWGRRRGLRDMSKVNEVIYWSSSRGWLVLFRLNCELEKLTIFNLLWFLL